MRVIETKPGYANVMGKKKHKLRKGKSYDHGSDSSDDEAAIAVSRCSHLNKAINLNTVKKALKRTALGECTTCLEGTSRAGDQRSHSTHNVENAEEALLEDAEATIWCCLQCGHQGCDRNSRSKHALSHYQTPRSVCHSVVVNLNTWMVWCYSCDDEVSPTSNGKLQEMVEFLRKQMGMAPKLDSAASAGIGVNRFESFKTESEESVIDADNHRKGGKSGVGVMAVQRSSSFSSYTLPKVKGLNNLGNTCFFNAVMQNLSQTPILENLLRDHGRKGFEMAVAGRQLALSDTSSEDSDSTGSSSAAEEEGGQASKKLELEPITILLPEAGPLTQSVLSFLRDMSSATKNTTISPSTLFGQVCKKAPRFKGFQQQDSHELLRHLLDGMRAEEIKRSQTALLKNYQLSANINPKNVGGPLKDKLKGYGRQVKHTFVDSVFGGYFISTVLCEECSVPSQILEPFLDVSLPITEQKVQRPTHLWPGGKKLEQKMQQSSCDLDTTPELADILGTTVSDQPSKHALKKAKRQAKKDSKRKNKGGQGGGFKQQPAMATAVEDEGAAVHFQEDDNTDRTTPTVQKPEEGGAGGGEEEEEEEGAETSDSTRANVDSQSHTDDDFSDADIEDNLDNDASRNRFQALDSDQEPKDECSQDVTTISDCSLSHNGVMTLDSYDANTASEAERTSISSATDSTVTLTEDNVPVNRTPSPTVDDTADITDITSRLESTHVSDDTKHRSTNNEKCSGICEPDSPRTNTTSALPSTSSSQKATKSEGNNANSHTASKANYNRTEARQSLKLQAMQTLGARYQPASRECSVQSCLSQFTTPELLTGNNKFGCDNCSDKQFFRQGKQGKKEMVYTNASKQVLLFSPPAVLTLHLKRFQQVGFRIRKINHHVDFPMVLDVAPNCSALSQGVKAGQTKVLYSLYGVVEHAGQMSAGHYTAYVKVRPNNSVSKIQAFLNNAQVNNGSKKLDKLLEGIKALREHPAGGVTAGATGGEGGEETVATPPGKWYYISDSRVSEVINESNILQCQAYLLFYERIL